MKKVRNYEEQVYAGVLGKLIGVYVGKPFEGWSKDAIEKKWGEVDRYVHADLGRGIVEPDDDISGTFTFIRSLEDSGLCAGTPTEFFGETWLNYLIEKQTILWWGGLGGSTEHTAYLRLKEGIQAPRSGSAELNGRIVSEQIGAQIFVDGFGMVAPGNPELAAKLARRAARVSHDGEAVHAAIVVAGMVSAAFTEKRMGRLLDIGVSLIPRDCLIARIHRDVRRWASRNRDWRKTFASIVREYGYQKFGGNCHVAPNHAVMVMAWAHAPDDFRRSLAIVNTAGWDTDCNSGNVGCVMGVKVGLGRLCEKYDFRSPVGDRLLLPTAEPSRGVSDALTEALHLARIGRRVMSWPESPPPKRGARWHFSLPGSCQGWMVEDAVPGNDSDVRVENVPGHSRAGKRSLRIRFRDLDPRDPVRVSVPVTPPESAGGYGTFSVPTLYPGMTVALKGVAGAIEGKVDARLFVRHRDPDPKKPGVMAYGRPAGLGKGKGLSLGLKVPDTGGLPVCDVGAEVRGADGAGGELFVDTVEVGGRPRTNFPFARLKVKTDSWQPDIAGWIMDADVRRGALPDEPADSIWLGKNEGRGFILTGSADWSDCVFECDLAVHLAGTCGLLARWQGQRRHLALVKTPDELKLVLNYYGETVLDSVPMVWEEKDFHRLKLDMEGGNVTAFCDGRPVLKGTDEKLLRGGAGIFFDRALIGVRTARVS